MNYTLYIGNKNYSTWSMRPWVVMKYFDIPFAEKLVKFDSFDEDSIFKTTISSISKFGTVPILVDNDLVITDSLAICEYLAEQHRNLALWPTDIKRRAMARSLVAKMHSGFQAIRNYLPMNIEAELPEVGQIILRDHPEVKKELLFLDDLLTSFLSSNKSNDRYLFGDFSIADGFYAPLCLRLKNYHIQTSSTLANYIETICYTKGIQDWINAALKEHSFVTMDEPYRLHR
ncbi:glutathione S-transferase [Gilliamella sp. B2969]|uniref:glutathione S-transferase family protein n=1 Tax=unclassified Gilliamella TaxID=2685620 RepID=UPI00226AE26F|nr:MULTISPECIES: glutathione S-transferase [unclassified Gilliamella]MCX8712861.1 glutathione S-transferase [Gilliamella sp. B3468]MCX8728644.1 glutathione S-transferase [Gilliamella sp. B2838]MCX8731220.1 glutathione S-transferase [Gilliamella sp. B2969]MCX8737717.1 glutathione S-transferase [Gilliamella sp. B2824]MCX8751964.1 glutathione S-transferase [Gilliamella sp. B3464]